MFIALTIRFAIVSVSWSVVLGSYRLLQTHAGCRDGALQLQLLGETKPLQCVQIMRSVLTVYYGISTSVAVVV